MIGHLVGLPTLKSILVQLNSSSNAAQINYTKLCNKLTINTIRVIFESVFEYQVGNELKKMASKDSSVWSKVAVTAVLDDSIFKQWLFESTRECDYFGSFFSGQYRSIVFGFKVVCFGLYIDDVFYPLYFDFVPNKSEKKENKSIVVAKKLVQRWGKWVKKLKKEAVDLPKIHLSCDSGYSHTTLNDAADKNGLIYISVPKKNHLFTINGKKMKLSKHVEEEFLEREKQHQAKQSKLKEAEKTAFTWRVKAYYASQKREVTLLFFRLKGSKKISVIYTNNKTIFSKTLRRNWFNRTHIEQFFKLLKHVLKISEARTKNKNELENKLLKFASFAIEIQKMIRYIRKKCKCFSQKGAISLQRMLSQSQEIMTLLQNQFDITASNSKN